MAAINLTATIKLKNQRAVKALATAAAWIQEQAEGRECDKEAQRALKAIKYAVEHLSVNCGDK